MITEMFNMFNRCHAGRSEKYHKDFLILVYHLLTMLLSDFYVYMRMLEVAGRSSEAELIRNYRNIIAGVRDNFNKGAITEDVVAKELRHVHDLLHIQVTMLRTIEGREWEAGLFQSLQNDLPNMAYHMENIHISDNPQRKE